MLLDGQATGTASRL